MIVSPNDSKLLSFLANNKMVAVDIETTGLNVRKDTIIGIGISNATNSFYVPIFDYKNKELIRVVDNSKVLFLLEILKSRKLLTWNGSFDLRFMRNFFGVDLVGSLYADVMLLKHTVDEERPFGLKDVSKKIFGLDATKEQQEMKQSIKDNGGSATEFFKADLNIMAKYCEQDCMLTYRLFDYYSSKLKSEKLEKFFYEEEVMPLYKTVTIPMENTGIPIDMPMLERLNLEIKQDIKNLEQTCLQQIKPYLELFTKWFLNKDYPVKRTGEFPQALARVLSVNLPKTAGGKLSLTAKNLESLGDCLFSRFMAGQERLDDDLVTKVQITMHGSSPMFNLSSKHHLKKVFFDTLKETPLSTTKKGAPQIDNNFLKSMAEKYDFVKTLLDYNKLVKLDGTYYSRFLERQEGGIYYPSFQQHNTTSGRYGSDIQQLPRQYEKSSKVSEVVRKYNNGIRDLIISGPGKVLVGADYASLEVVVFADDAGDDSLINMIKSNEDFYSRIAIDVLGLNEYSAIKDADNFLKNHKPGIRQDSKTYSLGIRYGMREFKLAKTLNIKKNEALKIINKYFESYPKLKQRMNDLETSAKQNGFVTSKAGRVRHLPLLKSLHATYGNSLADPLKLWEKYHENKSKYEKMKYLASQYTGSLNNCLNFPIQSMAASIVNRASISINKRFKSLGLEAIIIMNIHDELVCLCLEHEAEQVVAIMQDCMENTTKISAPLTAIPEVGTRYSSIK